MAVSNKKKKRFIIPLILVVALLGGLFGFMMNIRAVDGGSVQPVVVSITAGSSTDQVAQSLKKANLIRSVFVFKVYSKIKGYDGKYKAGTYAFKKSMPMKEIMGYMVDGKTSGYRLLVIEGMTIDKIAQKLEDNGIVSKAEFYKEAEQGKFNYEFLSDAPAGPARLEGFLYPNTYEISKGESAHVIIDKMLRGFKDAIPKEYYKEAKKQGKTWRQIVTTASIIEREAGKKNEKPKVASVIYNRLKVNMPLQMDSIISYIHKEDKIRATYSDIAVSSPYNPYTNKGLPPGPICSPGKDAIKAALYPAGTKYLYFVAKPALDGTNAYSETYEEFLKNKAAFDKAYEKYVKENPGKK